MRRITLWLLSTVAALVLLFSYRTSTMGSGTAAAAARTGDTDPGAAVGPGATSSPAATGSATTPGPSTGSGPSAGSSPTSGGKTSTYQGSVAQTRWGPVQVTITVANGKITSVAVPTYPNGNGRDHEINSYALPILKQETLSAQSATVDTVSGATVTSDGYKESLQAALDAAHLS
jgi:uncharacterized protein with FMN-binding domain